MIRVKTLLQVEPLQGQYSPQRHIAAEITQLEQSVFKIRLFYMTWQQDIRQYIPAVSAGAKHNVLQLHNTAIQAYNKTSGFINNEHMKGNLIMADTKVELPTYLNRDQSILQKLAITSSYAVNMTIFILQIIL